MALEIKEKDKSSYDCISLGEIMLRLDPGQERVKNARSFSVWEGGGEYNVTKALRKTFGLRTATVTALVDNDVGRLIEDRIMEGGVDTRFIEWLPFDGVGRSARNGLNFTERGFGVRSAKGMYDRGQSAASTLKKGDIDWEEIFGRYGVRWFHTGGIFPALSETTPEVVEEAVRTAKKYGTVVSYDLNYRDSLWRSIGGKEKAIEVNRRIAPYVDVMLGNEEDFTAALGFEVEELDANLSNIQVENYKRMIDEVTGQYPNFSLIATTLRTVKTANINDWGAICWYDGKYYEATHREDVEIYDRVGGGDSFASGLIYGLLTTGNPAQAVEYGAAHGALTMTTPGDTSMADLKEVEHLARGGSARVKR